VSLIRTIGRWSLTALAINTVIASGIFGLPGVLSAILGRASPVGMLMGGLANGVVVACYAEVASQFSQSGGSYLYVRSAFGSYAGLIVGWFAWLANISAAAANANLFGIYLAVFLPPVGHGWPKLLVLATMISIPVAVNYRGARQGVNLSSLFTIAKLAPLAVLIVLGLLHFGTHFEWIRASELIMPGWRGWFEGLLLIAFVYSGFPAATIPTAEVKDPKRTIPFALAITLLVCMAVFTLVQFVTVVTLGGRVSQTAVADAAAILIGGRGAALIGVAVLCATYGNVSAKVLSVPRLTFSLAEQGEFPQIFASIHSRFATPHVSILLFGVIVWLLAATGSFRWAVSVSAEAMVIGYCGVCAALIRLRRIRPDPSAVRVPLGNVMALVGIVMSLALLSRAHRGEAVMLMIILFAATANWWWVKQRAMRGVCSGP
jgi:APA family basic amino acid/polyamine antiporter